MKYVWLDKVRKAGKSKTTWGFKDDLETLMFRIVQCDSDGG